MLSGDWLARIGSSGRFETGQVDDSTGLRMWPFDAINLSDRQLLAAGRPTTLCGQLNQNNPLQRRLFSGINTSLDQEMPHPGLASRCRRRALPNPSDKPAPLRHSSVTQGATPSVTVTVRVRLPMTNVTSTF
jgi:hypothetical protein